MFNIWKTIKQFKYPRLILPGILAMLRGRNRYLPELEWSKASWVANIFRACEQVFGRDWEQKREGYAAFGRNKDGEEIEIYQFFSLESICCHIEQIIRGVLKFKIPIKIWIPLLTTTTGLPVPASPFLFAIAYDTTATSMAGAVASLTKAYTPTGSNSLVMVGVGTVDSNGTQGQSIQSVTYAGSGATAQYNYPLGNPYNRTIGLYSYLNGIADGAAHNVVITIASAVSNAINTVIASYSGVVQSGFPDAKQKVTSTALGTFTATLTTTLDNCWLAGFGASSFSESAGTGTTLRGSELSNFDLYDWYDSNGAKTPAGSYSIQYTTPGHASYGDFVICSFGPFVATNKSKFFALFYT